MYASILMDLGAWGALGALLLGGHSVADFWLQNSRMVASKYSLRWLLAHALVHWAMVGLLAFALCGWPGLWAGGVVALLHAGIDRWKTWLEARRPVGIRAFVLDQLLHLATLAVAWWWLRDRVGEGPWGDAGPEALGWMVVLGVGATGYAFCGYGAGTIVAKVLQKHRLDPAAEWERHAAGFGASDDAKVREAGERHRQSAARGQAIGMLERTLLLTLVLLDQWGALGFVLAAKSIARFKDLDERDMSEYYLVGTLLSTTLAVGTGLVVKLLV